MACIICLKEHEKESIEHIVPRALGNIHYILRKGEVCINCNNRFSRFEHHVLNSELIFSIRRSKGLTPNVSEPTTTVESDKLSRFLCKMAFESFHHSRPQLLDLYDLEPVRKTLLGRLPVHEALIGKSLSQGRPIPKFVDRWRLRNNGIFLTYQEKDRELWFCFRYVDLSYVIRLR